MSDRGWLKGLFLNAVHEPELNPASSSALCYCTPVPEAFVSQQDSDREYELAWEGGKC